VRELINTSSMMGPSVYGPQKNIWRGRRHCNEAEEAFTSLTETVNREGGMFPPDTYDNQAKEIEDATENIQAHKVRSVLVIAG
jgi:hypothetical protein